MKHLSNDEKEYIQKYYTQFGPQAISQKLGRSLSSVNTYAKKQELKVDKNKKLDSSDLPDFNGVVDIYDVLIKPMTKELAYFLGFFWADGTTGNNSITIEITQQDGEELLDLFTNIFNFSISYRKRSGRKPQISFKTGSQKAAEWFKKLGKYPKSIESHEKILNYIPKEYHRYFLIGLIDGDGCFYVKDSTVQFSISSRYEQDWSYLLEELKKYNPIISTETTKTGNSSILRITNIMNVRRLIKDLYANVNIGLSRKRDKMNQILNTKFSLFDFPITVNNIKYSNIKNYCEETGENHANVIKRLKSNDFPDYQYDTMS